jgi:outer membrane protein assembly factor BamB
VWRIRVPGKVESSPVVVDDTAYFGSTEGRLYAVNARTGNVRWAYNTGGRMNASPSIYENRVCISTYAGSIFCLDRRNGRKLWSTYIKRNAFSYESFYASASTDGQRLYTTSRAGKIVALSAGSGRVLWTHQMDDWGYATPAIAHGRVFVGGFDGRVRALRATDGRVAWEVPVGGAVLAPALVVGELVFVSTRPNFETVGLRASDGKIVWRHKKGAYSPGIATDRHYYFSLQGTLIAYRGERSPREN